MGNPNWVKGHQAWNKGKKMNYSPKVIASLRESMKTLRKNYRIEITCQKCGKSVTARSSVRKYCDDCVTYKYLSKKPRMGEPGIPYRKRNPLIQAWKKIRKIAIERDKGKCGLCKKYVGEKIDVHHIDGDGCRIEGKENPTPNHNLKNLICLCNKCHLFISGCHWYKKNRDWDLIKKLIL